MTHEYDLAELVKGSVDSITDKLGELSNDELVQLATLEAAATRPRTSLEKAISSEQAAREQNAKAIELQKLAAEDGVKLFTEADMRDVQADHDQRIKSLEAQLITLQGATPAKPVDAEPRVLSITGEAAIELTRVAFTDEHDKTLPDLPELEFAASAFSEERLIGGIVLNEPIVFPESARRTAISKVWLLDGDGKAGAVVELPNPLAVGGGSRASFPGKSLRFDRPQGTPSAHEPAASEAA